jgi:Co/Zn/Cd efflux system component
LDIGIDFTTYEGATAQEVLGISARIIILIALGMAVLFNYAIKQVVIMMHNRRNNTFKYNIINFRGFSAFLAYLVYMLVVSFILYFVTIFLGSRGWVFNSFGKSSSGIEPFTYVDGKFVEATEEEMQALFYQGMNDLLLGIAVIAIALIVYAIILLILDPLHVWRKKKAE